MLAKLLLGKLGGSFIVNPLTGKWFKAKIPWQVAMKADEGTIRVGYDF